MKNMFITNLKIENLRHLKNITIPLSETECKHVILTGKNGCGKTSVLQAMSNHLNGAIVTNDIQSVKKTLAVYETLVGYMDNQESENGKRLKAERDIEEYTARLNEIKNGVSIEFNESADMISYHFEEGQFVLAYYKADRAFKAEVSKHVEKIDLQEKYKIDDTPKQLFIKYLVDLKVTEALARTNGKSEKANEIEQWFIKFQDLLRKIFNDETLELVFEEDSFSFFIKEKNKEKFDFNSLSSGYAAVLDIVLDLIMRMEKATNSSFDFNIPGIVLIDEIEAHLHVDLQKNILELLTGIFPNVQFIVSTHSPFVLENLENTVVYDLEKDARI